MNTKAVRRGILIPLAFIGVLLIIAYSTVYQQYAQALWHLGTGWLRHPIVNLPHLNWNITTIILSLLSLTVGFILIRKLTPEQISTKTLLTVTGIAFVVASSAIAMSGIVHQAAWLARSPLVVSSSYDRRAAINGLKLHNLISELSDKGIYPRNLDELIASAPESREYISFHSHESPGSSDYFILLQPGKPINELDPITPVLAGLHIDPKRSLIIRADHSIEYVNDNEMEEILQQLSQ